MRQLAAVLPFTALVGQVANLRTDCQSVHPGAARTRPLNFTRCQRTTQPRASAGVRAANFCNSVVVIGTGQERAVVDESVRAQTCGPFLSIWNRGPLPSRRSAVPIPLVPLIVH